MGGGCFADTHDQSQRHGQQQQAVARHAAVTPRQHQRLTVAGQQRIALISGGARDRADEHRLTRRALCAFGSQPFADANQPRAAGVRLRPILMTTAAMVVGMIPLILASGAGARSRFDIGLVIAMGMAVGTLFTLFITPAVYTFIARDHSHDREKEAGVAVAGKPAAAEPRAAE